MYNICITSNQVIFMTNKSPANSIITTFGDDIYIIRDKTPDEVFAMIEHVDLIRMPNGARVNKKSIATIQSYEDYSFQVEQKQRHKKNQYLKGGQWHDHQGSLGISAELHRITGEIKPEKLSAGQTEVKQLTEEQK